VTEPGPSGEAQPADAAGQAPQTAERREARHQVSWRTQLILHAGDPSIETRETARQGDGSWAPRVLDAAALRRLAGDDAVPRAQLARHFMTHACRGAAAMRIAADRCNWAAGSALARRLASPACAAGALALGACCEQLELAFVRRDSVAVAELMAHLECQIALVGAWLA
jgi:hypothetical protein